MISAIIGDRSSMPIDGTTRRIGARIGSVMPYMITTIGLSGDMFIHEISTRPSIAAQSAKNRMLMNCARYVDIYFFPNSCDLL